MVLKQADLAISSYTDNALGVIELTRLHWQILRSLHEEPNLLLNTLEKSLFLFADDNKIEHTIDEMIENLWVKISTENKVTLTELGVQKHDEAFKIQSKVREKCMNGINEHEYVLTINILERLIDNLK